MVGDSAIVGVFVAVFVAVAVDVLVAVAVAVGVWLGVLVAVLVLVEVGVLVLVEVDVLVFVPVGVGLDVDVLVGVLVLDDVLVGVLVLVLVDVELGVSVGVAEGVRVDVGAAPVAVVVIVRVGVGGTIEVGVAGGGACPPKATMRRPALSQTAAAPARGPNGVVEDRRVHVPLPPPLDKRNAHRSLSRPCPATPPWPPSSSIAPSASSQTAVAPWRGEGAPPVARRVHVPGASAPLAGL